MTFSFKHFLVRNNFSPRDNDLDALIRRFDINRDGRITIREVRTILNNLIGIGTNLTNNQTNYNGRPQYSLVHSPIRFIDKYNYYGGSPLKIKQDIPIYNLNVIRNKLSPGRIYSSPSRIRYHSPERYYSPSRNYYYSPLPLKKDYEVNRSPRSNLSPKRSPRVNVEEYVSPSRVRLQLKRNLYTSPSYRVGNQVPRNNLSPKQVIKDKEEKLLDYNNYKPQYNRVYSPSRLVPKYFSPSSISKDLDYQSNIKRDLGYLSVEEEVFQTFLKEVISTETEIEQLKRDLALMSDFNLEDAFRIFERREQGYLNDLDIKYGLNFLEIFPQVDDITLVLKRFSSRQDQLLLS